MRTLAPVWGCVAFAAIVFRVKVARARLRNSSYAKHKKTQSVGTSTGKSHPSAELDHSQSHARAAPPNALKWLALFLLAGNYPADAIALPKFGHGQFAYSVPRPEVGHGHKSASINPNDGGDMRLSTVFQTWGSVSDGKFVRENSQDQKSQSAKLTQMPQKGWTEMVEKFNLFSRAGDPLLKDTLLHLRKTPSRFQRWSPVMSGAVLKRPKLERELTPPAPPPPNSGGGDGDGDEGGERFYLHGLSDSQAVELLNDWIARTRIYCMSDQFGNATNASVAELHRKSLKTLEGLQSLMDSPTDLDTVLMAMYAPDRETVIAFAECAYSWQPEKERGVQVVHAVLVSAVELNKERSVVAWRKAQLIDALHILAARFDLDLILADNSDSE